MHNKTDVDSCQRAIRQEALAHDVVIAESPFTLQVDSEYVNYVEGAIDLLAYNKGSKDGSFYIVPIFRLNLQRKRRLRNNHIMS